MAVYQPKPHQIEGARFLASRQAALLADEQRVGKTGAAIIAADLVLARTILVVTTASGRGVWMRAFREWSVLDRTIGLALQKVPDTDVVVVGWAGASKAAIRSTLLGRSWDVLILDEEHAAKNFETKRTQVVYGMIVADGHVLLQRVALSNCAMRVWALSGTPLPHSPADGYARLRALAPDRLFPINGWPDVIRHGDFLHRYCVVRMKKISRFNSIPVVIAGRNEAELRARMEGFILRRTQADIGMQPPVYETLPLVVSDADRRRADGDLSRTEILDAAARGDTKALDLHLGPLRRLTGAIKAPLVAEAIEDEFDGGLTKVVVMFWHREVGDALEAALAKHGVVRLDGSTTPADRETAEARFREPGNRVFLGQIVAAGEAIDLSAASELIFAETSFVPKDMAQASMRITNQNQERSCRVRVAALAGSIDEALQASLLRLWTAINGVLK